MTNDSCLPYPGGIEVRQDVHAQFCDEVKLYLPESAINHSDSKEFLSNVEFERSLLGKNSGAIIFEDILHKSDFIRTYIKCIDALDINGPLRILEIGADHGWASVILKANFPQCYVVSSDLVPDCIRHAARYEELMQVSLDEKWAFSVRDIPFKDSQFDRIFTFAAFHHFGDDCNYEGSLREIARVLRPGGKIVLLYEPSSPGFLHKAAHYRVNRIRAPEGVDEDVIVPKRLSRLGKELGLSVTEMPFPFERFRPSFVSAAYYFLVSRLRGLHKVLPCTYHYVLAKPI